MTEHFKIGEGVRIYDISENFKELLKTTLSIENPTYVNAVARVAWRIRPGMSDAIKDKIIASVSKGISPRIDTFVEHPDGAFEVPRGCLPAISGIAKKATVEIPSSFNHFPMKSSIVLRDYQEKFVSDILDYQFPFGLPGSGIAVAPPGAGKTVMGVELIARISKETLWITHTSTLAAQTKKRFKQFLPDVSVGTIGGGKWKPAEVTIALAQTLFRRDLSEIKDKFALVIVDECHHTPANTFMKVVSQLNYERVIGLSATPYRKDGLESVMFQILGPKLAEVKKQVLVDNNFLVSATVIQKKTGLTIQPYISDYTKLKKEIYKSTTRFKVIVNDALKDISNGHIGVILVDTIEQGKRFEESINHLGTSAAFVFSSKREKIRGKMKTTDKMSVKERKAIFEAFRNRKVKLLIATYDLLAEGFDFAPLDRLYMTIPISDKNRTLLEQVCGRVERPFEGKTKAVIYDYVDNHSLLIKQAMGRRVTYKLNLMSVE